MDDGIAYGLVSKGNGEAFLIKERCMALSCGGGQAGQGYPAVMVQMDDGVIGCFRKTAHPMNSEGCQGWKETKVADTLNVYDNSESRTPIVVCYAIDSHPEDSRFRLDVGATPTLTVKIAKGSADGPLVLIKDEVLHDREPSAGQQSQNTK